MYHIWFKCVLTLACLWLGLVRDIIYILTSFGRHLIVKSFTVENSETIRDYIDYIVNNAFLVNDYNVLRR